MFGLRDIPIQNQCDCWAILFQFLSQAVFNQFGSEGEVIVRKSVRTLGKEFGGLAYETVCKKGEKPNLKSCAMLGALYPLDPRFRGKTLRCSEQEQLWEIYTCPAAALWSRYGFSAQGQIFCEEYTRAYYSAYSKGAAYVNQSDFLTKASDNHCRFSVYYRPANLPADVRESVFSAQDSLETVTYTDNDLVKSFWLLLFASFYRGAEEEAGSCGISAITAGLNAAAAEQAIVTARHAKMTSSCLTQEFLARNVPVSKEEFDVPQGIPFLSETEKNLLYNNFILPFYAALDHFSKGDS